MSSSFGRYYRSLKYQKHEQIFYRAYYALRKRLRKFVSHKYTFNLYRKGVPLVFVECIPSKNSYEANRFTFLNKSVRFSEKIDWEYSDRGALWKQHLNYFDYLMQKDMTRERGSALIYLMIDHLPKSKAAKNPFSISTRGINWVKFISKHNIQRKTIDRYLYCQYRILLDNIAYDKMGSELLENAFSMLFGAYYFKGFELFNEAKILLTKELYEQILPDGGHFQLSPMYHQLVLSRVLDAYNLMSNNDVFHDAQLKELLENVASNMLGWLKRMTYNNGDIPCFNDSTYDVAPSSAELFAYAERLGLRSSEVELKESGYRAFERERMEGFIDVGNVGPYYQTDHAHSDTFNFELRYDGIPFIVDQGVSTYEASGVRKKERSTFAHNTVRVGRTDQTEVYGRFRVGRRAKITKLEESDQSIVASHDGFKRQGVEHQRAFHIGEQKLLIEDTLIHGGSEVPNASAFIHFHPDCEITSISNREVIVDGKRIEFNGQSDIKVLDYNFAKGFNQTQKAKMLQVSFIDSLETLISKE